jgi:hypothetical protein
VLFCCKCPADGRSRSGRKPACSSYSKLQSQTIRQSKVTILEINFPWPVDLDENSPTPHLAVLTEVPCFLQPVSTNSPFLPRSSWLSIQNHHAISDSMLQTMISLTPSELIRNERTGCMASGNTDFVWQVATLVVIIYAKHTDPPRDTAAVLTRGDEIMTFHSKCGIRQNCHAE